MTYTTCSNGGYRCCRGLGFQALAAVTRALNLDSIFGVKSARRSRMKPPFSRFSVYFSLRPISGFGPPVLGIVPYPPLPLTTSNSSPATSTPHGYQPAGMRPLSESVPRALETPEVAAERSNTAAAFASASATNRRVPSGDSARAFGVAPSDGPVGGGSRRRATPFRVLVSTTATWSVLPDATKSRVPSRLRIIADG